VKKRFEALDAFRGLCAISVVVYYMRFIGSITEWDYFQGSGLFVEFFFVLSGFVLAHGYGFKENLNFKQFMKARCFRLYPLHFVMFLFVVLFNIIKLLDYKYSGITFSSEAFSGINSFSKILPNLLLIQSWTPYTEAYSFNGPSWNISIEFYMYALLFFSISFFKSNKMIARFVTSLIVFALIYLESDFIVKEVFRGLSCFFGGAITYVIYKKIADAKISKLIGSLSEFLLLVAVVMIVQSMSEFRLIIGPIIFIATVLLFSFESGYFSRLLRMRPFQYVGQLSYSIYMTLFVIMFYITALFKVLNHFTSVQLLPVVDGVRYKTFGDTALNNIAVFAVLVFSLPFQV
jgi:peptidoglycan/LPS O-acetylase OafA/YrhL